MLSGLDDVLSESSVPNMRNIMPGFEVCFIFPLLCLGFLNRHLRASFVLSV